MRLELVDNGYLLTLLAYSFSSTALLTCCPLPQRGSLTGHSPSGVSLPWHGSSIAEVPQSHNSFVVEHLLPRVCLQPRPRQCPLLPSSSVPLAPSSYCSFLNVRAQVLGAPLQWCAIGYPHRFRSQCDGLPTWVSETAGPTCSHHRAAHGLLLHRSSLLPPVPKPCQLYPIH